MHSRIALVLAAVVVLAAGCNRSPVAPTPAESSSLSGSWVGTYLVSCPSAPTCGQVAGGPPSGPQPFSLLLNQDGNTLSGQVNLGGWLPRVADVTGTIAPDGTMSLQGGMSWSASGFCQPAGGWRLTTWTARHDPRSNSISGAFSFVTQKHLSSCYYQQDLAVEATSVSLTRGTLDAPTFASHWQGTALPVRCSTVGWTTCFPSVGEGGFELNLMQDGASVSGTFGAGGGLPVSGTADGATLRLHAVRVTPVSGGTQTIRIVDWVTQRDVLARLTGTYRVVDEIAWNAGPNAGSTWSTTYDVELRSVVRVPW